MEWEEFKKMSKEKTAVRMQEAVVRITELGYNVEHDDSTLIFQFKGHPVYYYPRTGWHSGKTIKDGRGLDKLLKQIKT